MPFLPLVCNSQFLPKADPVFCASAAQRTCVNPRGTKHKKTIPITQAGTFTGLSQAEVPIGRSWAGSAAQPSTFGPVGSTSSRQLSTPSNLHVLLLYIVSTLSRARTGRAFGASASVAAAADASVDGRGVTCLEPLLRPSPDVARASPLDKAKLLVRYGHPFARDFA